MKIKVLYKAGGFLISTLAYLHICTLILVACHKSAGDSEKPVITITSPSANQQFNTGQTVNITGSITDNDLVHEIHVIVTNKATSAEILHVHEFIEMKSYTINTSFVTQAGITYKFHIEANDNTGNTAITEFEITSH